MVPVLPESAPFSPAQRAWLNGFFAGLLGLENGGWRMADGGLENTPSENPQSAIHNPQSEEFPWHDPTLPMEERLKLAEGRPLERVLMAAMAQLDCGSCGYLCQTYAEEIAGGEEPDLNKCVPGGRKTAKKLKELMAGERREARGERPTTSALLSPLASRLSPLASRLRSQTGRTRFPRRSCRWSA
jgi:sulfite reductase (NADPH) flavoprotein alpha-component